MTTANPTPEPAGRPLRVSVEPGPGVTVVPSADPTVAIVKVPVIRVPASALSDDRPPAGSAGPAASAVGVGAGRATAPAPVAALVNTQALPNDVDVLKQMIAELLQQLRRERQDRQALEQRLDALLKRWYGPRPARDNPEQGLLFPHDDPVPPPPPPPAPPEEEQPPRRKRARPHGRRRPPAHLRQEERRYELSAAERLCPECGQQRQEIGVETTYQQIGRAHV